MTKVWRDESAIIHRKYVTTGRNTHEGVLILIHTSVTSKQVHSHKDILTVSVSLGYCSLTVIGIYSPRSSRLPIDELRTQFTAAAKMIPRSLILLMGDLNVCSISWGCKAFDSRGNKFEALCEEFDLAVGESDGPTSKRILYGSSDHWPVSFAGPWPTVAALLFKDIRWSDHFIWKIVSKNIPPVCARMDDRHKDFFNIEWGLPQGSALSPLIYIPYVADLTELNEARFHKDHFFVDYWSLFFEVP
ncbi:unnamed protein product [Didymodactylos carnosus]|uniref:Endonuclease/exonuclease/phosphatase domain-containing protein n=1 Tax=Didymodactylos carnosus TaxID=1234261 RepID=A0A8S2RLG6_9BILA|nr:unnamed protein product [Didymodactylos carnosus]CAF4170671.1 unnamed protein product [Didymodactylos carnosus]